MAPPSLLASLSHHYRSHWSDLPRRMTTICIGVPVLWYVFLHDVSRLVFFHGLAVAIVLEWSRVSKNLSLWWSLMALYASQDLFIPVIICMAACDQIFFRAVQNTTQHRLSGGSSAFMTGVLLITIPFYSWIQVQRKGFGYTVSLLLVTWNADTGSLIAGRMVPTRKRRQPTWLTNISPGKSIEGLIGGFVGGTGTCMLLGQFWRLILRFKLAPEHTVKVDLNMHMWHAFWIGASLSIAASLGDLWESSLKRQWGVKDTSKLLPGHGGILDRFDSSLVAVLLYEYYINHGMV